MNKYDVLVIGSGPGGYSCAIRCSQNNLKTAIVEKYPNLGGVCLNVGCIPSKNLLHTSDCYYKALKDFSKYGIEFENLKYNWQKMQSVKKEIVNKNRQGLKFLMKKNKIETYEGIASFESQNEVSIIKDESKKIITAKNIVIATGSKASSLPKVVIDKKRIISSTEALSLNKIPQKMIIIGAGVIGCEMGSIYAKLGTKVQMIEYSDSIIPTMDTELGNELKKSLSDIGIEFFLSTKVIETTSNNDKAVVKVQNKQGEINIYNGDYCLISVGRSSYIDSLQLNRVGVELTKQNAIYVKSNLETTAKNIYAIGDVTGNLMLAHKAEEEGIFVADTIAGKIAHINYNTIPSVVYTSPEVASVGQTEKELKDLDVNYKKGVFPFKALGKANAVMETDGLVKVLADKKTDKILGVHIIGSRASDLIAEAVIAMEYQASSEDIAITNHAHPTFSEALKEACADAFNNKPIHL